MNAFTSRDLEAADKLALARLDDDGAPPAVSRPQAETTAIVPGEVADQTPALLGAGWLRKTAARRRRCSAARSRCGLLRSRGQAAVALAWGRVSLVLFVAGLAAYRTQLIEAVFGPPNHRPAVAVACRAVP